ncbi:MAG TPA: GvpL/GvpF family gas vesicle protein [Clostridia bacterium]|nr:GvpL/GvpF family gas vesicle protein [Clostridia bacterium]
MAWYAYCITEQSIFQNVRVRRPFPIENLRGINGTPVFGYPSGEFAVIVSEYSHESALTQSSVVEHARVVSECFRNSTVLPFRFGTIFENDDALRQAVRTNRKAFGDSVAHLRGKAEMHIKVTVRGDGSIQTFSDVLPAQAGGEYLMRLREKASRDRERQTKARALSVQVHKLFNPLEEEVSCKKVVAGGMTIDIAHLIDTKQIEKYQNRYSTASRQLKNCELAISGPWPPYHFMPGKLRTVGND